MNMCDVIVIIARGAADKLDDETLAMNFAATNIDRVHGGAVACTVPGEMIHHMERDPAIAYVRRVQNYLGSLSA
jgi:hypothetical protein